METKKVVVEVPKNVSTNEVKAIVKKLFSFNVRKYYGKSKDFPKVRVRWQLSA
jgi:hypothetical protein